MFSVMPRRLQGALRAEVVMGANAQTVPLSHEGLGFKKPQHVLKNTHFLLSRPQVWARATSAPGPGPRVCVSDDL